jgi:transcriptional regulator with GAF, ATPase, and Fis domain
VLATGNVIRPEHLTLAPVVEPPRAVRLTNLQTMEREHVSKVLEAVNGHKARAARILGISRPRLDRLLSKYDLTSPSGASEE